MARVRGKDSKPEMAVRRLVHSLGYRYRLHSKHLVGRPDLVFPGRKRVIFVHGCFWHQHGCRRYRMPRTRLDFWLPKLRRNVERDEEVRQTLAAQGWRCLVIWECQCRDAEALRTLVTDFLEDS